MGHGIKDCNDTPDESKELSKEDLPFSLALKARSILIGKVSMQLGVTMKKSMPQHYYLGRSDEGMEGNSNSDTIQGEKEDVDEGQFGNKRGRDQLELKLVMSGY
ncbi:hypothetical protein PVK06_043567 [Gossypium arboreum]|uniref:Uncharacterized protein n=1 Tax=Gossypium arboreum TaxID=29729 RepID=A0ABR0MNU5_GOSAR|nr:hypothetical protein PVK06_043567 [Gossypium arboreum]